MSRPIRGLKDSIFGLNDQNWLVPTCPAVPYIKEWDRRDSLSEMIALTMIRSINGLEDF